MRLKNLVLCVISLAAISLQAQAENILVLGGTGRLGAEVVKEFAAAGHDVSVFARPTSSRSRLEGLKVSYITGDLSNLEQVASAVTKQRFDVVVDASARRAEDMSYDHGTTMAEVVKAARASGVQQIILFSSVGAGENIKRFSHIQWGIYEGFLKERGRAEQALMDGGVSYTIIRTGHVPEDESEPKTGTAELTEDQSALGSVTRPDLAELARACMLQDRCRNKVYHAIDSSRKPPV